MRTLHNKPANDPRPGCRKQTNSTSGQMAIGWKSLTLETRAEPAATETEMLEQGAQGQKEGEQRETDRWTERGRRRE